MTTLRAFQNRRANPSHFNRFANTVSIFIWRRWYSRSSARALSLTLLQTRIVSTTMHDWYLPTYWCAHGRLLHYCKPNPISTESRQQQCSIDVCDAADHVPLIRAMRWKITSGDLITLVCKSDSCMLSKLRSIFKRIVGTSIRHGLSLPIVFQRTHGALLMGYY